MVTNSILHCCVNINGWFVYRLMS